MTRFHIRWPQVWGMLGICIAVVAVIAWFFYSIPPAS